MALNNPLRSPRFARCDDLRTAIALYAAGIILCFAYLCLCMARDVNVYDEGIILYGADRVLHGDLPHRDFYTNYGPAQFYSVAALFKLFGASVVIERVWDTATKCCLVAEIFVITNRFSKGCTAFLAAGAGLVFLASPGLPYSYPVFPALAAVLAGLLLLLPARHSVSGPAPRAVCAGLCLGIATLFRYDIGVAALAAGLVILTLRQWIMRNDESRHAYAAIPSLPWLCIGFAIIVGPVAIVFALCGVLPDLIFDVVTFQAQYYARTRSLPFPMLAWLRIWPMNIGVYLPFLACAACVATIFALLRQGRANGPNTEPSSRRRLVLPLASLLLLTALFITKGIVRVSPAQMSGAIVVSIIMLGILAQPIPDRGAIGRLLAIACLALTAVLACLGLADGFQQSRQNIAWAIDPRSWRLPVTWPPPAAGTCRMPAGLERLACTKVSADTAETIRFIQRRTSPGAPVFVGLSRHDKIFANDVLLYFAMNRPSATKWHHFDPGLQTSSRIQQAMVQELRQTRPEFAILETRWADIREPNESANSSGVTILDDYLRTAFTPVAAFGYYKVMKSTLH